MSKPIGNKAVLLYPRFPDNTFWSWSGTLNRYLPKTAYGTPKRTLPPLGMMGLGNHLKDWYDEVILYDLNIDPRPVEELIRDADHVFMGGMGVQEEAMVETAKRVRKAGKTLILGGTAVDEDPQRELSQLGNHRVTNESEMVIDTLLEELSRGRAAPLYKGIASPPERFFRPDFKLIDPEHYVDMAVQISRGCPEACNFCDITERFGRSVRMAPWEHTQEAFKEMHALGIHKPTFIVDDNFIGRPTRALEVAENFGKLWETLGTSYELYTELTMRLSDDTLKNSDKIAIMPKLRSALRKANFTSMFIGVETPNEAALAGTKKPQNLQRAGEVERSMEERLAYISSETGASVMMGMIYGFDEDSKDTVKPFIDFVNATHVPTAMVGLLTALPHTELERGLRKEGRLLQQSTTNNTDGVMNFIPLQMSAEEAEKEYASILQEVFTEEAYFTRLLRKQAIVDFPEEASRLPKRSVLYGARKILTGPDNFTILKYLPQAHKIAVNRFGFNSPKYKSAIKQFLTDGAKYTHLREQAQKVGIEVQERQYAPEQQYSWQEMQGPIAVVDVAAHGTTSLTDRVRVALHNGYEIVGERVDALRHFVGPHLRDELKALAGKRPTLDDFIGAERAAWARTHAQRPRILDKLPFSSVADQVVHVDNPTQYLREMTALFSNAKPAPGMHNIG